MNLSDKSKHCGKEKLEKAINTRIQIIKCVKQGIKFSKAIADQINIHQVTVNWHLEKLEKSGNIKREKIGHKITNTFINDDGIEGLVEEERLTFGSPALDKMFGVNHHIPIGGEHHRIREYKR
jgi:hypothetical protein